MTPGPAVRPRNLLRDQPGAARARSTGGARSPVPSTRARGISICSRRRRASRRTSSAGSSATTPAPRRISLWLRGVRSRFGARRARPPRPERERPAAADRLLRPATGPARTWCGARTTTRTWPGSPAAGTCGSTPATGPFRRALAWERSMYDSIDLIFCMSEALAPVVHRRFRPGPRQGARGRRRRERRAAERTARARSAEPLRLLFVGKRFERKGGPTVVAAFEALRADYPEAELWIVGPTGLELDRPGITVHGRIAARRPGGRADAQRAVRAGERVRDAVRL